MNSKVASSLALRVSWLKFEPWSRILPVKYTSVAHFTVAIKGSFSVILCYIKNVSLIFMITHKVEVTKENDEIINEVASRNK